MKFWKQKAKQRLNSHGKEFSAQEALLAKLVAAPGEYKRKDGFDLQEILAEEDKTNSMSIGTVSFVLYIHCAY